MTAMWTAAVLAGLAVWLASTDQGRLRALAGPPWWRRLRWPGWLPRLPRRAQLQRQRRLLDQLPETLELLAAALDAGAPPRVAATRVAAVAPGETAEGLLGVVERVSVGLGEAEAWAGLAEDEAWGDAAREMSRAAVTGTGAAAGLRRVAGDVRTRGRDEATRRARTVGVRAVLPLVCCYLPAFALLGVVPIIAGLVGQGLLR